MPVEATGRRQGDRCSNPFQISCRGALDGLKGQGKLTEKDVERAAREIRLALLEADVNFKVVKQFVDKVKERALGAEVLESLTPVQQFIKIVNEELTAHHGVGLHQAHLLAPAAHGHHDGRPAGLGQDHRLRQAGQVPARRGQEPGHGGRRRLPSGRHRPAEDAWASSWACPSTTRATKPTRWTSPSTAWSGRAHKGRDVLIIDTAGRLHIDEKLMDEIARIRNTVKPHNILLVLDAMTGQDAVNVALQFQEKVQFDGVILTKMDGDARGGAALSVRAVTGKPIKFACSGEKLDNFEYFHPDRVASRILGMGDVLSLIEKAEKTIDEKKARELEQKLRKSHLHVRRLPGPDPAGAQDGLALEPAGHDPRHPLGQAEGAAGGRQGVRQDPGRHLTR